MTSHYQQNHGPFGRPAASNDGRKTMLFIALGAVAVLLITLLGVRFAFLGDGAVDSPSGLSVAVEDGAVKAAWTGVSGADEYVLSRDDGVVVYQGPDTTAVDDMVSGGEHTYRVQAVAGGVMSAPGNESKVTAADTWGDMTPLVKQFPELLPQSPDRTGWESVQCRRLYGGFQAELGTGPAGSGKALTKARLTCGSTTVALGVAWLESKDATDQVFTDISKQAGAQAVRWRYGTGYAVESAFVAYLRSDIHPEMWFAVGIDDAKTDDVIDMANTMPLE